MIRGWQELIWAIVALAIAVLVAYGLVLLTPHDAQGQVPPLQSSAYDERLDQLDREAIEHAYVQHVAKLFGTWMADYSSNSQPFRMQRGHRNARQGYIDTMTAVDQRKSGR
jgi:hypothetical protein